MHRQIRVVMNRAGMIEGSWQRRKARLRHLDVEIADDL